MIKLFNACIFADELIDSGANPCDGYNVITEVSCHEGLPKGAVINEYIAYSKDKPLLQGENIYVPSLFLSEKEIDNIIDFVLGSHAKLMVRCASNLDEVGYFDVKYKLSPVMFLHKCGILENAKIVGGVCLDKDDVALMVQENAEVILTPTFDCGMGNGIAPVLSFLNAGLKIGLGTFNNRYNSKADLQLEAYVLNLAVSAAMNKADAIKPQQLLRMLSGK